MTKSVEVLKGTLKGTTEVLASLKAAGKIKEITSDFVSWVLENENKELELTFLSVGLYKVKGSPYILHMVCFSEILEPEKPDIWTPERTQVGTLATDKNAYFYLDIDDSNDQLHMRRAYNTGIKSQRIVDLFRAWKTRGEVEEVEETLTLYRAMRRWSFDNDNGFNFTERQSTALNWYIDFDPDDIRSRQTIEYNRTVVYFSTRDKAEACLKWLESKDLV